jgi:hypothetical protein
MCTCLVCAPTAADQRVASMGGMSWSYGELPRAANSVIGSSGSGLGLRLLLSPREDGTVSFRVLLGGGAASLASTVGAGLLPERLRSALAREEWVSLWMRHDERGLYLNVSDVALLSGAPLGGFAPHNHWSFAFGACGVAPKPRSRSGGWDVANLTMRSGARLRFADEVFAVTLDGQQLLSVANTSFRYYAAPRPTLLTPNSAHAATQTRPLKQPTPPCVVPLPYYSLWPAPSAAQPRRHCG